MLSLAYQRSASWSVAAEECYLHCSNCTRSIAFSGSKRAASGPSDEWSVAPRLDDLLQWRAWAQELAAGPQLASFGLILSLSDAFLKGF